ncbi:MAG: hypothetical protein DI551_07395 [Micavibrio aeruginosavorus]|uniref:Uncharacterized protein n=1 Tax=Micavibrio aeruginosavorus TaxID=349221 RepID=A0A2W5MVW3_9BACT|nr:MAG: hypothetical protein DI551_07395 [Micavibrio aeruginosavorus]
MQHDDKDLNRWLSLRAMPPSSGDLAERIIHAAVSQIREKTKLSFWAEVASMITIPHPSVAVATGLVLGLVVGMQTGDGLFAIQDDWSSFLYVNEGGWL